MKNIISKEKKKTGEISVILCSDEDLLQINKKFLKKSYYTDIITFDYSEGDQISGDLYISFERIKENALQFQVSINDELKRVIIHGVLHLLGLKDNTPEEKSLMRESEDRYLLLVKDLVIIT